MPWYYLFKFRPSCTNLACVHGSTNGTNGITISSKVLPMVPLVLPLVPMVMPMVPLALQMVQLVPLVSQWYYWLPMVPLVKIPMVPLGEPRTEPLRDEYSRIFLQPSSYLNNDITKEKDKSGRQRYLARQKPNALPTELELSGLSGRPPPPPPPH